MEIKTALDQIYSKFGVTGKSALGICTFLTMFAFERIIITSN